MLIEFVRMAIQISCTSLNELPEVVEQVLRASEGIAIWALEGDLGAGKTTFLQAAGKHLGVREAIQSPTFSLVNEYTLPDGTPVYHFDFYRLETAEEALDIGAEEYFYSGARCWIEWASRIEPYLPVPRLSIYIHRRDNEERIFEIERYE
ncbi:tRNA (adenosine(37)-N6)-threonylcarbamoyltransferase complex ATPase subunit type 1 TsaE [Thermonema rossianum]|uniref:tRNA (adenosine(37)-N6)-threonylcarbamoyltransferase complex ATPase subunit type 1 TsaE n=1 Tax=Thermonema rossianum TaxID=55505 RepID=UPI001FE11390|nr:tRNA (adenosine(37)-N6)-threonylcarbamoyltransferase complex ATPase subunit type 1 TsaE [Thermonema rossianum]